jgi:hypothetical protein
MCFHIKIIIIIIIIISSKIKCKQLDHWQYQHHPRVDIDRLYVPRKEGGRGLMQVEGAYIAETVNLVEYVENKDTNCKDTPT